MPLKIRKFDRSKLKRFRRKKTTIKSKPSRLRVSRTRTSVTRAVAKVLQNYGENKFQGKRLDCIEPRTKQQLYPGQSQKLSYIFLNSGNTLGTAVPNFTPLNLFTFPVGDTSSTRVGNYMYIKHAYCKMNVQCLPIPSEGAPRDDKFLNSPLECRLMVVKSNRKYNPLTISQNPAKTIFLNTENGKFGFDGTDSSINLYQNQPINKRQYLVYMDKKFVIEPPAIRDVYANENTPTITYGTTYAPGKYPHKRQFSIKLPIYKKCHFDDTLNVPDNVDSQWLIMLQVSRQVNCFLPEASQVAPTNFRMEFLGTTTAADS